MSFSWRTFLADGRATRMRSRVASLAAAVVPAAAPILAPAPAVSSAPAPAEPAAPASAPASAVAAPETVIYVYGITRDDAMTRSAAPLVEGIVPGARVKVLSLGDFAILFNHVPKSHVPSFDAGDDDDNESSKEMERRHHRVLENLSLVCTVVPVHCGTVYPNMKAVVSHFTNVTFRSALSRVAGAHEWCVRLFADIRKCCARVESAPMLGALKAELAAAAPAHLSMARNRLYDAIDREVCNNLAACAGDVHRRLGVTARAAKSNRLRGNGREVLDGCAPALILDAAYLIEKRDEGTFHRSLAELNSALAVHGFSLKFSGPWPPYSFAAPDEDMAGSSAAAE